MTFARRTRIRLAAALYELALHVAPADVAATMQGIVADGRDLNLGRLQAGVDGIIGPTPPVPALHIVKDGETGA